MQGLVSMIAVSAVLSAGLVAGLAATDAAAGPKPAVAVAPNASPAAPASGNGTFKSEPSKTAPACTAAAWPYGPAGCAAEGRKVRIIALTAR